MSMEKEKISKEVARSESLPATPRRNIPARSLTLPANSRLSPPAEPPTSGFFSRLKRYFRVGSKGRYNISTVHSRSSAVNDPLCARNTEQSPSQSLRQLRRNIPDKEEVILLHKGPRLVGGSGDNGRMLESGDTIVQIVGASHNIECRTSGLDEVMSSEQHRNEASLSDDILDEMDPGYETLDEVRKKVQMQLKYASVNKSNDMKVISEDEDLAKEASQVKDGSVKSLSEDKIKVRSRSNECVSVQENGETFTRDSGVATPQTDSPESCRESNTESVNSSVVSESTGIADESGIEVDMLDLDNINMFDHLSSNSAYSFPSGSEEFQQRHSSDSFLMNTNLIIEEELYANPKVISRKRSQKQNLSQTETSVAEAHLSSASLGQENIYASMPEKSVSEGDVSGKPWRGSSVESDKSAPPIPERKYTLSEDELFIEEGSLVETLHADKAEGDTSAQIESKVDETSEESTLDAVSEGDVVTDNEVESMSENIAVDSLDDGYQTIKDVQAQKEAICSNITHIGSECMERSEDLIEQNSHLSVSKDIDKCVESKSHDSHTCTCHEDGGDYETLTITTDRSPARIEPSPDSVEPSLNCVEPSLNCVGPSQKCVEPSLNCVGPSQKCVELFPNCSGNFEFACMDTVHTESLADTSSQMDSCKKEAELVMFESEQTHVLCDQVLNCYDNESTPGCMDDISASNQEPGLHQPELREEMPASNDEGICDVTMRDKSGSGTGRNNVVVIKLHESAHEDFGDPDFTDFEPVLCSNRDLIRQLEQSGCHDNTVLNDDRMKNGAACAQFSAFCDEEASAHKESVVCEDGNESRDYLYVDDEPIHMTLEELRHPRHHNETSSVISSSAAHPDTGDSSVSVPPIRSDQQRESSSELTTSDYHQAFLESMSQLKDCGWYWGPLSYSEAEKMLMAKPDGSFLVRDSSSEHYILSLSFKCVGTVCHTRIEHHKGVFSFFSQPESHGTSTIRTFIEHAVEFSHTGQFLYFLRPLIPGSPPVAIQLLYPVSRFLKVPSLQHMCRFLILRSVRRDHIDNLPVPEKVKDYLREHQYYVENLEDEGVLGEREQRVHSFNTDDFL